MDPTKAVLERHRAIIGRVGWAVTAVSPGVDGNGGFSYTVGLTAIKAPEFVIAGLPAAVAQNLLNDLAIRVVAHGERFAAGQRVGDLIRGYDAIVVEGNGSGPLSPSVAYAIYGTDAVVLQQVVWPDPEGRFPWEERYKFAATRQPVIGSPVGG